MSAEPVRTGKRKCRWCGKQYRWPIGTKSAGCPDCQLSIPLLERAREVVAEQK